METAFAAFSDLNTMFRVAALLLGFAGMAGVMYSIFQRTCGLILDCSLSLLLASALTASWPILGGWDSIQTGLAHIEGARETTPGITSEVMLALIILGVLSTAGVACYAMGGILARQKGFVWESIFPGASRRGFGRTRPTGMGRVSRRQMSTEGKRA